MFREIFQVVKSLIKSNGMQICSLRHRTPASSKCAQLCTPIPLLGQSTSRISEPVHPTSSRRMGPVPWPNCANETAVPPVEKDIERARVNLGVEK